MSETPRVLVTGARGFVGRQCLEPLIKAGYEVHAVAGPDGTRRRPNVEGVTWHASDLLDPVATGGLVHDLNAGHLLHLAWFATHDAFWTGEENLSWVGATLHLLREWWAAGGRRCVVVGTCAEYGPHELCHERDTTMQPMALYGACKHATHQCLAAATSGLGVSYAWARLFFPYGPHDQTRRLIPYVIGQLLRGEPAECSSGTQIRDFLHVRDVGSALAAQLSSEVTGPVNIASGKGVAIRKVVTEIGELMERPDLLQFGATPLRSDEPMKWVASVDRLRDEVGWQPSLSLRQGLEETIAWYRSELTSSSTYPPQTVPA